MIKLANESIQKRKRHLTSTSPFFSTYSMVFNIAEQPKHSPFALAILIGLFLSDCDPTANIFKLSGKVWSCIKMHYVKSQSALSETWPSNQFAQLLSHCLAVHTVTPFKKYIPSVFTLWYKNQWNMRIHVSLSLSLSHAHTHTHTPMQLQPFPLGIADVTEKTWSYVASEDYNCKLLHMHAHTHTHIHYTGLEQMDKEGRMWPEEWCMTGTAVLSSLHSRYASSCTQAVGQSVEMRHKCKHNGRLLCTHSKKEEDILYFPERRIKMHYKRWDQNMYPLFTLQYHFKETLFHFNPTARTLSQSKPNIMWCGKTQGRISIKAIKNILYLILMFSVLLHSGDRTVSLCSIELQHLRESYYVFLRFLIYKWHYSVT